MRIEEISNDRKRRVLLDSPESWKVIMEAGPIRELEFNRYGLHMVRIQIFNNEIEFNKVPSEWVEKWRDVSFDPFLVEKDGTIGSRISRTDQLAILRRASIGND